MKISNLDYAEAIGTETVVGGNSYRPNYGGGYNYSFSKNFYANIYENAYVNKYLNSQSYVYGNSALAEADAKAFGNNSNAEGFSFTYSDPYSSAAGATSISQSS